MSRRRPTLTAYVRRRWRALGLILVLLAGSLLVLAITDRGHDPLWDARGAVHDQVALAPSGDAVYSLILEGGNVTSLQARRGDDGLLLWESPMSSPRALLRAGDAGVAVATDFPYAFLTFYGADGSVRWQVPLEGNPRAMGVEGDLVALALQAPGNPVLVLTHGQVVRTHRFDSFVNAIDLADGRLAAGTGGGEVAVFDAEGERVYQVALPLSVRSLRMTHDGMALVVGGFSLEMGDISGGVAFIDLQDARALRWVERTPFGVGYVDLDRAGVFALALEESPPRATAHVYEALTGARMWSHLTDGNVAHDDAGAFAGAALAPDGRTLVLASLRGPLRAFAVPSGEPVWSFGSMGSGVVAFAREHDGRLAASGRLAPSTPYEVLFVFSPHQEPVSQRVGVLAVALCVLAAGAAVAIVGLGYWRARRSY